MVRPEDQTTRDAVAQERTTEVADPREAWLEFAATDVDGGAAVLATAARHGRPLPRREP